MRLQPQSLAQIIPQVSASLDSGEDSFCMKNYLLMHMQFKQSHAIKIES